MGKADMPHAHHHPRKVIDRVNYWYTYNMWVTY